MKNVILSVRAGYVHNAQIGGAGMAASTYCSHVHEKPIVSKRVQLLLQLSHSAPEFRGKGPKILYARPSIFYSTLLATITNLNVYHSTCLCVVVVAPLTSP